MQVRITVLISVLLFAGCTGIGPPTVDRDRFDSVSAISELIFEKFRATGEGMGSPLED